MDNKISFEEMPQAILQLIQTVNGLKEAIDDLRVNIPKPQDEPMVGIDEACRILQRAKSTIYALCQSHKIPFYQPGKMLQFKRSELMAWMESGKQETNRQTHEDIAAAMQKGIRHKPKAWSV